MTGTADVARYWFRGSATGEQVYAFHLRGEQGGFSVLDLFFRDPLRTTPILKALAQAPADALDADLIILRSVLPRELEREGLDDVALGRICSETGRARARRFALLTAPANSSAELRLESLGAGDPNGLPSESVLREAEIRAHLERTGGLLQVPGAHFVLPSGAHTDSFVRVGDMLDSTVAVERIGDWLLDLAVGRSVIVGDTWTILPLLLHLAQRAAPSLSDVPPTRHAQVFTFDDYPSPEGIAGLIQKAIPMAVDATPPSVLFVVSAVSSGQLVERFKRMGDRYLKGIDVSVAIIANLGTADRLPNARVLLSLPEIKRFRVPLQERCELCHDETRRSTVVIDPRRFAPVIEVHNPPQMLRREYAVAQRDFWKQVSDAGAIRVHHHDAGATRPRHLMLDVRVDRLLNDSGFRKDCVDGLRTACADADAVLIPEHETTGALAHLAQEVFPSAAIVRLIRAAPGDGEHAPSSGDFAATLAGKKSLLVLDDALIDGTGVLSLHRFIQDHASAVRGTPDALDDAYAISAFVLLARPKTNLIWEDLTASLQQLQRRVNIFAVRLLPLPAGPCPWCLEAELLERLDRRLRLEFESAGGGSLKANAVDAARQIVAQRLALLSPPMRGGASGMETGLFLCDAQGAVVGQMPLVLSPHSLFGESLGEAAAFGAVASAMHRLRMDLNSRELRRQGTAWHWNLQRIVTAYHDPLLQASFLRLVESGELLSIENVGAIDAIERALFRSAHAPLRQRATLAAEWLFASSSGKLPRNIVPRVRTAARALLDEWQSPASAFAEVAEVES